MGDHEQYSDDEFVERVRNASLDPVLFTHEAHLRLGWILVRAHGPDRAAELLCGLIAGYASAIGKAEKFDRRVTIAAAHVIAGRMERSHATDSVAFISEAPELRSHFRELVEAYLAGRTHRE